MSSDGFPRCGKIKLPPAGAARKSFTLLDPVTASCAALMTEGAVRRGKTWAFPLESVCRHFKLSLFSFRMFIRYFPIWLIENLKRDPQVRVPCGVQGMVNFRMSCITFTGLDAMWPDCVWFSLSSDNPTLQIPLSESLSVEPNRLGHQYFLTLTQCITAFLFLQYTQCSFPLFLHQIWIPFVIYNTHVSEVPE